MVTVRVRTNTVLRGTAAAADQGADVRAEALDALRRIATARSRAALARLLLPARWDPPPTPNAVAPVALGT